jgi:hypothetical protein
MGVRHHRKAREKHRGGGLPDARHSIDAVQREAVNAGSRRPEKRANE